MKLTHKELAVYVDGELKGVCNHEIKDDIESFWKVKCPKALISFLKAQEMEKLESWQEIKGVK